MSQKIIIPKGTIDSTHTTIIEIPNYLHETSTVVVTTPKTADLEPEEIWEGNEYEENSPEQNEEHWEQDYEAQDVSHEPVYPPEQQEGYQYVNATEDVDPNLDRQADSRSIYGDEQVAPRRSVPDQYADHMMRRMMDKKRELAKLRFEKQRLLEGEAGTYEMPPQMEDNAGNLSEVPENMKTRPSPREMEVEKERRRKMMESQRYQSRSLTRPASYRPGYPRDPSSSKYTPETQNQNQNQRYQANARPLTQQWTADVHGYPDAQYAQYAQYARQGQPRPQYAPGQMRKQVPQQVMSPEDMRQYQKAKRKAMFNIPKN